jgi:hypothetical protein
MCAKPKIKTPAPPPPAPAPVPRQTPGKAKYERPRLRAPIPDTVRRRNASIFGSGIVSPLAPPKTMLGFGRE